MKASGIPGEFNGFKKARGISSEYNEFPKARGIPSEFNGFRVEDVCRPAILLTRGRVRPKFAALIIALQASGKA